MNTKKFIVSLIGAIAILSIPLLFSAEDEEANLKIDPVSGMAIDEHWDLVRAHCVVCHSTKGFT